MESLQATLRRYADSMRSSALGHHREVPTLLDKAAGRLDKLESALLFMLEFDLAPDVSKKIEEALSCDDE